MRKVSAQKAIRQALEQGFLSAKTLDRALADDATYERVLNKLNQYMDDRLEVEIPGGEEDFAEEREPAEGAATPASDYPNFLRNRAVPKLSRQEERRLAKRMEFYRRRLIKAIEHADLTPRERLSYLRDVQCECHQNERSCRASRTAKLCLICEKIGVCPKRKKGQVHTTCKAYNRCRSYFVERNLHLVVYIAQPYQSYGIPLMDLIQEGNTALIRAVEKFDWRKNVRLQTYAEFWVRQAIERLINANRCIVRVPTYMQQRMRKLRREGKIAADVTRVNASEASEAFQTSALIACHLLETERGHLSLDALTSEQNGMRPSDLMWEMPEESMLPEELNQRGKVMHEALARLTAQERTIIQYRFGMDGAERKTLSELGKMLQISRERVRQIESRTLEKLRRPGMLGNLEHFI